MMHKVLVAGTTALVLSLGAGGALANGPNSSPYDIMVSQPATPSMLAAPVSEGRAAVTDQGGQFGYGAPPSPAAEPVLAPEDRTYYSRGR